MKYLILTVMVLGQLFGFCQSSVGQTNEWDTLRLRTSAKLKAYDEMLQRELRSVDTTKGKDVEVITFYSANRKKLRVISNDFDTAGCLLGTFTEYYNEEGYVEYQESYKKCYNQKLPDDKKCFEHVVEYGRFQYDPLGRIIVRVYHLSMTMNIKETYTYSEDGKKQIKRKHIREPQFWDS